MNRIKKVITDKGISTYEYDENGNRKSLELPGNISTTYEFDQRNLLVKLINKEGITQTVYQYGYDANGLQTHKIEPKGRTDFEYDLLARLKKVTEPDSRVTTYTYDRAGNRKTQKVVGLDVNSDINYIYDAQNRLTSTTEVRNGDTVTTVYEYDNNGNQTKVTVTDAQGTNVSIYTYDELNRLKSAKTPDGKTVTNKYDISGLRVEKTVDGETTKYYYDGKNVALEIRADGTQKQNTWGVNLISRHDEKDNLYYLYNGHADVVKVIDQSGVQVNEYDYDVFGNAILSIESKDNPYRYAGYYYDDETGYYYLRSRYYDPKIARFISEDTYTGEYTDPLSLNLYTYCHNDPITGFDPDGYAFNFIAAAVGAAIGAAVNTAIAIGTDIATGNLDWRSADSWKANARKYLGAAASGAIGGAMAGFTCGGSLVATVALGAAGSAAGSAADQLIRTGKVDARETIQSAAVGGLSAGAGKLIGDGLKKFSNSAAGKTIINKGKTQLAKAVTKVKGFTNKSVSVAKTQTKALLGNNRGSIKLPGGNNTGVGNKGGLKFGSVEKLKGHFGKHGGEFKGVYKNADEYLQGANDVVQNGYKVQYKYKVPDLVTGKKVEEIRTGYVRFMETSKKGVTKFEFVGTNNAGEITTYHVESGKDFWKMLNGSNVPEINPIK